MSITELSRLALSSAVLIAALIAQKLGAAKKVRSLFGDARFASAKDLKLAGFFGSDGILVGKYRGRHLFFPGQQFVLVAAPTRSGKGVGVVIPNLLTYPGSVVVLDIKGENYDRTSGFRRQHGQHVFRFSPFSENGARFNPLQSLSDDPKRRFGEVMALAGSIYPLQKDNPFWNEQAANLFVGLVLYLCENPHLPRTLSYLTKLLEVVAPGSPRRAADRMAASVKLSDACIGALRRFASVSEAIAAAVLSSFNAPLLVFTDPMVAAATEHSDFELSDVRKYPTSIYVCIEPQHLNAARVVLNLFFTQLIFQNTQALPHPKNFPVQCLLLLDEFTAMGRVDILAHSIRIHFRLQPAAGHDRAIDIAIAWHLWRARSPQSGRQPRPSRGVRAQRAARRARHLGDLGYPHAAVQTENRRAHRVSAGVDR